MVRHDRIQRDAEDGAGDCQRRVCTAKGNT
jgi:hypothetical protein